LKFMRSRPFMHGLSTSLNVVFERYFYPLLCDE
jgi:hypothetical protein